MNKIRFIPIFAIILILLVGIIPVSADNLSGSIQETGDDGMKFSGNSFQTNGVDMKFGSHDYGVGGKSYIAFMRFQGVSIPQYSTINSAVLSIYKKNMYGTGTTVKYRISLEAVDNSTQPTTYTDLVNAVRTSAHSDDTVTTWTNGAVENSIDFKSAVQEVINRSGWSSGNALTVLVDDNGSDPDRAVIVASWDDASFQEPRLVVDFTVPTSTFTPTKTSTPTITRTFTITPTASYTPTNTVTSSITPTFTNTPTNTPTFTNTPTNTPTLTATNTFLPTWTNSLTPSSTYTPTPSFTPTITNTTNPAFSPTPSFTPTLAGGLVKPSPVAGVPTDIIIIAVMCALLLAVDKWICWLPAVSGLVGYFTGYDIAVCAVASFIIAVFFELLVRLIKVLQGHDH
jgi:hypothetical protein